MRAAGTPSELSFEREVLAACWRGLTRVRHVEIV